MEGDAEAYTEICAEDVQLLIPGNDIVHGKDALLSLEKALFTTAKFERFEKIPVSVERNGTIAVEVGYQEVMMKDARQSGGVFASRQKYTHIYRHSENQWKVVLLMSNPCD